MCIGEFSEAKLACSYWMELAPDSAQKLKKPHIARANAQAACIQPVVYSEREPAFRKDAAAP
jgi:hypothetical protein